MAIILDIETIAMDGVETEPVQAPANYKDAVKIAAYVAEKQAEQVSKAALYPWTARAIAIGYCDDGDEAVTVKIAKTEVTEGVMLGDFWHRVYDRRSGTLESLVTFNGLGFDLPVLVARSRLLGIPTPDISLDRYRSPHPDLMQILTFRGAIQARSLKWFAHRFGLNVDDAFSGKEIATLYEDGNWDAIISHVTSDVTLTRQLAQRLGVIRTVQRV